MKTNKREETRQNPVIVCSSDANYAMPLTIMLKSLILNLKTYPKIQIYIPYSGINNSIKSKILTSIKSKKADIKFIQITNSEIPKGMKISGHISIAAYYGLLIPDLLPKNIEKVIYLDTDIVIKGDIGKLWDKNLGKNSILAVQGQGKNAQYVSSPNGLLNYKELKISPNKK